MKKNFKKIIYTINLLKNRINYLFYKLKLKIFIVNFFENVL